MNFTDIHISATLKETIVSVFHEVHYLENTSKVFPYVKMQFCYFLNTSKVVEIAVVDTVSIIGN